MKKRIMIVLSALTILLCAPLYASAAEIIDSGECGAQGDNVTWTLDYEGTLTISGEGEMVHFNYSPPWIQLKSDIKNIVIQDGVTTITAKAFSDCMAESITISSSIALIEDMAMNWCVHLTNISVDENNENYCSADGNLFSKDMKTIVQYALGKADTSYEIPYGVEFIGAYAFSYGKQLTNVKIPESVTGIGENAFRYCPKITDMVLPPNLKKISGMAFCQCGQLTNITIPDGVTEIGYWAFNECYALKQITLPISIQKISSQVFTNLKDLYYKGTEGEWNNIDIDIRNNCLNSSVTYHYNAIGTDPPEIAEASVQASDDDYILNIQTNNINYDSKLVTVLYDENGVMTGIKITDLSPLTEYNPNITIPAKTADKAKAFIWSDINGLRSLCEAIEIPINQN